MRRTLYLTSTTIVKQIYPFFGYESTMDTSFSIIEQAYQLAKDARPSGTSPTPMPFVVFAVSGPKLSECGSRYRVTIEPMGYPLKVQTIKVGWFHAPHVYALAMG